MCFGDSNTYGCDPRPYLGGRCPESVRWTGQLKLARSLDMGYADTRDWGIGLAYDGVHFSEEGRMTFAKRMSETLSVLFQE